MNSALNERLQTEADLCRNEGADDIANLLDETIAELAQLRAGLDEARKVIGPFAEAGKAANDFPIPDNLMISQVAYTDCKDAAAWLEKYGGMK